MKRLIFASLILICAQAHAFNLQWPASPNPPTITNSTVTFSSTTVTTISSPGYFEVTIPALNSTYYYRLDSSTISLTSVGFPVANGSTVTLTGFNEINFLMGIAGTSQTVPTIKVKPN